MPVETMSQLRQVQMHKSTTTKLCTGPHLRNIDSSTDCGIRATNILVAFLFPGARISSCFQTSSHYYQKGQNKLQPGTEEMMYVAYGR
jgi:hypothetical protein